MLHFDLTIKSRGGGGELHQLRLQEMQYRCPCQPGSIFLLKKWSPFQSSSVPFIRSDGDSANLAAAVCHYHIAVSELEGLFFPRT